MLKSFFQIAIKMMAKNKLVYLINVLGLAVALSCCLVIFIFVDFEYSVDRFHKDVDRIFLVTEERSYNDEYEELGKIPTTLGLEVENNSPEVELMTQVDRRSGVVKIENKDPFYEAISFVKPNYLDLFNFPLKSGDKTSLKDPSKVVISDELATKYFGNSDPINKVVKILVGGNEFNAEIAGVAEEFPKKKSFEFDILINRSNLEKVDSANILWKTKADATFIKLTDTNLATEVIDRMNGYVPEINRVNVKKPVLSYNLQPLKSLALNTYRIKGDLSRGYGPPTGRLAMMIIGFILLTVSCLNYVNTVTALSMKRLKEVGVRKVLGSNRKMIISQFMIENFTIVLMASIIAILITKFIFLPGFDGLFQIGLEMEFTNLKMWLFLLAAILFTSILSGAYPSLYISKFDPASILQNSTTHGGRSIFSKLMLTIQYIFALVYIVAGIMFVANENFQKKRDLGYDNQNLLVVSTDNQEKYTYIKNKLSEKPNVIALSGANQQIGYSSEYASIEMDNLKREVLKFEVEPNYLSTMKIEMIEGSVPNIDLVSDNNQILVNNRFIEKFEIEAPIGKRILIDDQVYHIGGITNTFYYSDFQSEIEPVIFKFVNNDYYSFLNVKTSEGQSKEIYDEVKMMWNTISPNTPPNVIYQDESIKQYFNLVNGHTKVMIFTAFLAILLSTLGLFGLVFLDLSRKLKNYSVMKVFGASPWDLIKRVSKNYIWYILASLFIGIPSSYFSAQILFSILYRYHVPINSLYVFMGVAFLLIVTMFTISFIVFQLTSRNPMEHLREN